MTERQGQEPNGFPRGFDAHRRQQLRRALQLTPLQRLQWLDDAVRTLRAWQGRARPGAQGG